jgi:hypothetical protein
MSQGTSEIMIALGITDHIVGTASLDNYMWSDFEAEYNTVRPCGCQGLPHYR